MSWSKQKIQMESFLSPSVKDRVSYRKSGYRYAADKKKQSYLEVDKKEVFKINEKELQIKWFESEQEIKKEVNFRINIDQEELNKLKKTLGDKVPDDRLKIIYENNKINDLSKAIYKAQTELFKTDFQSKAMEYLSLSVDDCLSSEEILLNVFAIIDRRVGKKRLASLADVMANKHPIVNYFYQLRK